jgi:hypothetical protein
MGNNTSTIYAKEEEGDYLLDHKFISKSNPRRGGFITHFYVL